MNTYIEPTDIDPTEAPAGYYAVLKSDAAPKDGGNICRACDWRAICQSPDTDHLRYGHRCMDYPITAHRDSKTYQRQDHASVVFKQLPVTI